MAQAKTFCPWMPSAILAHKTSKQALSTGWYVLCTVPKGTVKSLANKVVLVVNTRNYTSRLKFVYLGLQVPQLFMIFFISLSTLGNQNEHTWMFLD
jgi:hypothetical protein